MWVNFPHHLHFITCSPENDFPVQESGQRQSHAAFMQQGFVQRFEFDISSAKKLKLNYWYHDADRDIQPTIGNTTSTDEQADQNHRLSVSYEQNNTHGSFVIWWWNC